MAFTWDKKFVLRRTEQAAGATVHEIFVFAKKAESITDSNDAFNAEPYVASTSLYQAVLVLPHRHWNVSLGQGVSVDMSVFQLKAI